MTFSEFVKKYDKKNTIVLLEGKRQVAEGDQEKLVALGRLLASKTKKMTFRSGNASGSDQLFSDGVASVDNTRLQVITPYSGHRDKTNRSYETISLDDIDLAAEEEVIFYSRGNKKTAALIDPFLSGEKNRHTIKAAYIIRDTIKVLGAGDVPPATFGIFYDDLSDPKKGGTGHTMQVCEQNQVPLIDQKVWFNWLTD